MILRRIIAHVRKQEWTAIAIDFVIVVAGVFVGLQVNNWNASRAERARLDAALASLDAESASNIDVINAMIAKIEATIDTAEEGRKAIATCAEDAASAAAVVAAISLLSRDFVPTFNTATTISFGARDDLLDRLSPTFRKAFWTYQARLSEEESQLQTNFELIWANHISRHPALDADLTRTIRSETGADPFFSLPPMASVCTDAGFRQRFMTTAAFIDTFASRLEVARKDVLDFRDALERETAR